MKHFDIVLVLDYFRSAAAFLSIIKYLSPAYSLGLCRTPGDPTLLAKNAEPQRLFLDECVRLGAEMIGPDGHATAGLMVIQQRIYPDEVAVDIMERISAFRRVGLMNLATAGIEPHDRFLRQFAIDGVYVTNRRLFDFLVSGRSAQARYSGLDIEQVGLPFKQYRVFSEFAADYLIAAPTRFSFKQEVHKHRFLEAVLRLLDQLPGSAVVVYKPHNGSRRDYFAPRVHSAAGAALARVPAAGRLLGIILRHASGPLRRECERLYTSVLHARILRRAVRMADLTAFSFVALEAFLPGVRKGVIGGLSNTMWGTFYFGLPFYNCVDQGERDRVASELLPYRDSTNLLDLNLQFFGVPYCEGELAAGCRGDEIITDADRLGDLLHAIAVDCRAADAAKDRHTVS